MILVVFFYNRGSLWTACGVLAISASASYNTLHLQIKVFLNSITAFFVAGMKELQLLLRSVMFTLSCIHRQNSTSQTVVLVPSGLCSS